MNKFIIAVAFALVLGGANASATMVTQTFDVEQFTNASFPDEGSSPVGVSVDLGLGRPEAIQYKFDGTMSWNVDIQSVATTSTTLPLYFRLYIADGWNGFSNPVPIEFYHSPVSYFTFPGPYCCGPLTGYGVAEGSFDDGPNQYLGESGAGVGSNYLTIFPNLNIGTCMGGCEWDIFEGNDTTVSFVGTLTQTVCYGSGPCSIPEPSSFALLTLGAAAAGFAATRRLRSR